MNKINLIELSKDAKKNVRGGAKTVTCCTCERIKDGSHNYTNHGTVVVLPPAGAE